MIETVLESGNGVNYQLALAMGGAMMVALVALRIADKLLFRRSNNSSNGYLKLIADNTAESCKKLIEIKADTKETAKGIENMNQCMQDHTLADTKDHAEIKTKLGL